jgi:hypothetical protein
VADQGYPNFNSLSGHFVPYVSIPGLYYQKKKNICYADPETCTALDRSMMQMHIYGTQKVQTNEFYLHALRSVVLGH